MDSSVKHVRKSPEEKANIFSKLFYWWFLPFFKFGYKNDIEIKDIYNTSKQDLSGPLGDALERNWEKELENCKKKKNKEKPSLQSAIFRTFFKSYIVSGVALFVQFVLIRMMHPLVLAEYIHFFDKGVDPKPEEVGWLWASAVILMAFGNVVIMHAVFLNTQRIGMRVRISVCSLIYRKLLKLNHTSLGQTEAGQLVNLLSNDVLRFDLAAMFLHYLWLLPVCSVVAFYIMYRTVGLIAAVTGMLAIILESIPLQGYLSRLQGKLRYKIALRTDKRIKMMNEITSGIQVIKMYAWEAPFEKVVELARKLEVDVIAATSYIQGVLASMAVFTERLTLYATVITFVLVDQKISGDIVFSMAQLFNTVQLVMAIFFPRALSTYAEAKVSVKRIEDFLTLEENPDKSTGKEIVDNKEEDTELSEENKINNDNRTSEKDEIELSEKNKLNEKIRQSNDLEEIDLSRKDKTYDKEIIPPWKLGSIELINVTASWIPNPIVPTLTNINMVIKPGTLCCIVGSVGSGKSSILQLLLKELSIMSGRMNITGKVAYASQEPWLFVSNVKDNILFGRTFLQNRYQEVIRVCSLEKDLKQLPFGDKTLVGERGTSLSGGQKARVNLARAVYTEADIYLFDDPLSAVDARVGRDLFDECIVKYLSGKTRILVTHQLQFIKKADLIVIVNNGKIEKMASFAQLSPVELQQLLQEPEIAGGGGGGGGGGGAGILARQESVVSAKSGNSEDDEAEGGDQGPQANEEEVERGSVTTSVYMQYWRAGGSVCFLIFTLLMFILAQVVTNASDLWLTYWTNAETLYYAEISKNDTDDMDPCIIEGRKEQNYYILIYTILIVCSIVLLIFRSFLYFIGCMTASKVLHNRMFGNIIKAPMRFFDTNPSGRILNRFSKDMGAVDELLPRAQIDAIQIFMVMAGILVMVFIVTPWMILPTIVLGFLFFFFRLVYLTTAQAIKRLEGVTRAPVFSHVSSSLYGMSTIRAAGAESMITKEFDILQDQHTSTWFLFVVSSTAFGFYLDVISTIFLTLVTFQFLVFRDDNTVGGNIGLVISQSLILTGMVQYGFRQTAEVSSQMISVERVLQYTKQEQEGPFDPPFKPPKNWPEKGRIIFKNTFLRYTLDLPPVLKNLNVEINSGEKVGIVGRTGAGKSTLIASLFRLAPIEGTIDIDGVDTKEVGLKDLRLNISIIPQEPILFSKSLRYNLDPFEKHNDEVLWKALADVELKTAVTDLNQAVSEGGSNFSAGQRQLICLARAIVRNNKILVMDEATANVDPQTDSLIQKTIRERFKDCTVLTIAHRLNTVMDSDRVLVMDAGEAVEFDHAHVLIQNPEGHFKKMLKQTGSSLEKTLKEVAKEDYIKKHGKDAEEMLVENWKKRDTSKGVGDDINIKEKSVGDNNEQISDKPTLKDNSQGEGDETSSNNLEEKQ